MKILNFKLKINQSIYVLIAILILGFCFRFYGIDFDKTCCQHPDERAIIMFTLPISFPQNLEHFLSPQSPLNPHFFAYGNFPLYLLKITSNAASVISPSFLEYSYINYVGRFISILADLVTIFLIFKIGSKLFGNNTGLAGAFIYSISVLPIQYSHFYTSDILLTMFITLTLWRIIKFYNNPTFKNAVLTGICFGLALATKISAVPILASVSLALAIDFIFVAAKKPHRVKHWLPHVPNFLKKLLKEGLLIIAAAAATFIIFEPYAVIDRANFIRQNLEQSRMTSDAYIFPYTLQYVGKIPYLYEIKNIFLWGLGPLISIFSVMGLYLLLRRIKTFDNTKRNEIIIILAFSFIYFLIVGKFAVGFMRYMLPIYPLLALAGGVALSSIWTRINQFKNVNLKIPIKTVIIIALLIWPISFLSIYSRPNTRIAATAWVNKNIPQESSFTHEVWDDTIPMNNEKGYIFMDLGMYDQPDDNLKWERLNSQIREADYIVLASNRLYTPIQNLADCSKYKVCFPIASKFYQDLFANKLNYIKVAEFTSYPTIPLANIVIEDQSADESFTVYDHPKVMIYKRK